MLLPECRSLESIRFCFPDRSGNFSKRFPKGRVNPAKRFPKGRVNSAKRFLLKRFRSFEVTKASRFYGRSTGRVLEFNIRITFTLNYNEYALSDTSSQYLRVPNILHSNRVL
ncbi:hypothetical protein B1J94_17315 [Leptospira kirschneri serovar Grippotyphosa]|nr:hypothetical protein B1J94_17315 [Leptospira kirschneri serovar Grippotyphosa]